MFKKLKEYMSLADELDSNITSLDVETLSVKLKRRVKEKLTHEPEPESERQAVHTLEQIAAAPVSKTLQKKGGLVSRLLKSTWLPECKPKRIIVHWTGGSYAASGLDKEHYHFVVDGNSKVHRGYNSIRSNMSGQSGPYAAHTYGLNTDSIGVSAACMGGPGVSSRNPGSYPLREEQYNTLVGVVAELCLRYGLSPVEAQVLMHGDIHRVYGIDQWGKWDINFLPWNPGLSHEDVGHEFRQLVGERVKRIGGETVDKENNGVTVEMSGIKIGDGVLENGTTFLPVRELAEALGLAVAWSAKTRTVTLVKREQ